MSDIIIITIADEDYVESWFLDSQSSKEKASQTFAVRSKTDKSPLTHKTHLLDVYAKRHQLENAVRVKQERKARTQSRKRDKRDKIKRNRHKKSQSASRLRLSRFVGSYSPSFCLVQHHYGMGCIHPFLTCKHCLQSISTGRI